LAKQTSIRQRWKKTERMIAEEFGGKRNPLSGASNYTDDGKGRVGDIVGVKNWLIEVKDTSAKNSIWKYYKKTRTEAMKVALISLIHAEHNHTDYIIMSLTTLKQIIDVKNQAYVKHPLWWITSIHHSYYTNKFPFGSWIDKLDEDYKKGMASGAVKTVQKPMLVVHPKGARDSLVIITLENLMNEMEI